MIASGCDAATLLVVYLESSYDPAEQGNVALRSNLP
jgi:hypothetical protein